MHLVVRRRSGFWWAELDGLAAAELLHFPKKHCHGHAARPLLTTDCDIREREQTLGLVKTHQD
jgi:hypothetical protein